MRSFLAAFAASLCFAGPVAADDVTDTIDSARTAYEEGDIQYAAEELTYALQLLNDLKAGSLRGFLPEPRDGWTREFDEDMATGMGMMGGGIGAKANYSNGTENFSITLMADNPMVGAMGGMLGNSALLSASGAKIVRVGREKFVNQDGQLTTLVANRVLVQAEGASEDAIVAHLEEIDFRELGAFGN
jgi:hypothetical protein